MPVVPILQAVLAAAQKAVGIEQAAGGFGIEYAVFGELLQRFLRAFKLQGAVLAAADHLENLRGKLDFADAAGAEFDVVVQPLARDFCADLAVQAAHCFIGAVIEIAAEDKRAHQRGDAVFVRRDYAGFAPGIALPLAPLADQILLERGFADHQRAAVAVGAKAHIGAEHKAFALGMIEQGDQLLADLGEKLLIVAAAAAVGFAGFGIDENQIEIGRNVQFKAAGLAHRHHAQMLLFAAVAADRRAVKRAAAALGKFQRGIDGKIRQQRDAAGYFVQRRRAAQIAHHNLRQHMPAQHAQRGRKRRFVAGSLKSRPVGKSGQIGSVERPP